MAESDPYLRLTSDSCRVDETYVKIKGARKYLYRAVYATGQTTDFLLSAKRDARTAKRFFRAMLTDASRSSPRVINVDNNPASPPAVEQLKEEGTLPNRTQPRQCKYLYVRRAKIWISQGDDRISTASGSERSLRQRLIRATLAPARGSMKGDVKEKKSP